MYRTSVIRTFPIARVLVPIEACRVIWQLAAAGEACVTFKQDRLATHRVCGRKHDPMPADRDGAFRAEMEVSGDRGPSPIPIGETFKQDRLATHRIRPGSSLERHGAKKEADRAAAIESAYPCPLPEAASRRHPASPA